MDAQHILSRSTYVGYYVHILRDEFKLNQIKGKWNNYSLRTFIFVRLSFLFGISGKISQHNSFGPRAPEWISYNSNSSSNSNSNYNLSVTDTNIIHCTLNKFGYESISVVRIYLNEWKLYDEHLNLRCKLSSSLKNETECTLYASNQNQTKSSFSIEKNLWINCTFYFTIASSLFSTSPLLRHNILFSFPSATFSTIQLIYSGCFCFICIHHVISTFRSHYAYTVLQFYVNENSIRRRQIDYLYYMRIKKLFSTRWNWWSNV